MDILSKVSERLKDLMYEAEIRTPALAKKTNIDQSVISKFLRAERMPSVKSLVTLADFFNCSTDYILGLTDFPDERTYPPRPPFGQRLNFLLEHFQVTKYRLEKQTGFSEETVNRWQRGKYEPTAESLVRLAEYFGCSTDFILGRES